MPNPNTETIKEFLVSINFDQGENGADKFAASIEDATIKANIFADIIIATAKEAISLLTGVIAGFDDLYFASERSLESVANIKSIEAAMKFFGVSSEATRKSVEAIAALYRRSPGELANIEKLGFVRDQRTGQFHYDAQVAARYQAGMPDYVVEALIARLGIDQYFGRAIHEHPLEVGQRMQEYQESLDTFQLDPAKAAYESHKAAVAWTKLTNDLGIMADALEVKVLPLVTKLLTWADQASNEVADYLSSMKGLSAKDYEELAAPGSTFGLDDDMIQMAILVKDVLFYLDEFRVWAEGFFAKLSSHAAAPPSNDLGLPGLDSQAPAGPAAPPSRAPSGGPTAAADAAHAPPAKDAPMTTAAGYEGLRLYAPEAVSGGPASQGIVDLGRQIQANDPQTGEFHAFNDSYHHGIRYHSKHTEGLAFDVSMNDGDYNGARQRARAYLTGLGMSEGAGADSDFWIEPGTGDHMHIQFNSQRAADKYESILNARRKDLQAKNESTLKAAQPDLKPPATNPQGAIGTTLGGVGSQLAPWLFGPSGGTKPLSPWDDWKPGAFGVPSEDHVKMLAPLPGGVLGGDSMNVNRFDMPQTTKIDIDGSSDPMTTAALVAQSQERVSAEAAKSLQSAVSP
jgi:hypothetical protein